MNDAVSIGRSDRHFSQEDGYWKLLIDRRMIDQVTGDVIEQKAVKPVFDKADILGILQGEVDRFHKQHADFEKAAENVAEMWERGDIRKAAKSKEVRQQVSDYEDTQMVRAIADYADDGGRVQHSPRRNPYDRAIDMQYERDTWSALSVNERN